MLKVFRVPYETALIVHVLQGTSGITQSTYLLLTLQACNKGWGEGGKPPLPFFENQKKCPDFGKTCPDCDHP